MTVTGELYTIDGPTHHEPSLPAKNLSGIAPEVSKLNPPAPLVSRSRAHRSPAFLRWLSSIVALLALFAHAPSHAGRITLQLSTTPTVREGQLLCRVQVTNSGDEAASNVQAHVEFQGRRHSSPSLPSLGVQKSHTADFSVPLSGVPTGRHSLAVSIDYTDANGYAFTALSYASFILGADNPPKLHAVIEPVELGRDARLEMRLKNLDSTPRQLALRLILPKEISSSQAEHNIMLGGSSEQVVRFELRNFSALEGSIYQVFVLSDYEGDGGHSSLITPGTIKIVAASDFFRTYRAPLIAGIAVLMLLFLGVQVYSRFRK